MRKNIRPPVAGFRELGAIVVLEGIIEFQAQRHLVSIKSIKPKL